MRIYTSEESRRIDEHAVNELHVSVAALMENAGSAVAEAAVELMNESSGQGGRRGTFFVVCGPGNNGGDGFVAARHLHSRGEAVVVQTLSPDKPVEGAAGQNASAARACGIAEGKVDAAGEGDVVVDAIFGTGLSRAPSVPGLQLISAIQNARNRGARVLAVDLPSGVDADRPRIPGIAVRADRTIALHSLKPAHLQFPSRAYCGKVQVAGIGIPWLDDEDKVRRLLDRSWISSRLQQRPVDAHKGTAGHVLVIAGSPGKSGAAMLAATAALRAGAGLVTVASSPEVLDRILPSMPEVMGHALPAFTAESVLEALDGKDAWVAGPGMLRDDTTGPALVKVLKATTIPACLDADALNALAASPEALAKLSASRRRPLLTPHPAELARLLGRRTEDVQADRFAAASEAASRFNAHVILKGAFSVIVHPSGALRVNPTGNAAMATAGTGDVLSGVCGALLAQDVGPAEAAEVGVWVHGAAGDLAAQGHDRGLIASDLVDVLPQALAGLVSRAA